MHCLEHLGYRKSFRDATPQPIPGAHIRHEPVPIKIDHNQQTVEIGAHDGFDPGGIGKGVAADLIADEALAAGAAGVLIDLGGDVRVAGQPPESASHWSIEIDDPLASRPFDGQSPSDLPIGVVDLVEGAVATSSRMKRRWTVDGEPRHHLIDPRFGLSVESDVAAVTVVAALGWQAEVLAKAAFVGGPVQGLGLVAQLGGTALLIDEYGHQTAGDGWSRYFRSPEHLAHEHLTRELGVLS